MRINSMSRRNRIVNIPIIVRTLKISFIKAVDLSLL